MNSKLVMGSIGGVLVVIAILFTFNPEFNPHTKIENSKSKNQTNVEENMSKNNETLALKDIVTQNLTRAEDHQVIFVGHVKHIISECAPSRSKSQQCVFFDLAVLQTSDGKMYQLTNATFPYLQLENKQIEVTGTLIVPSTSKFVPAYGDINVARYSVIVGTLLK